jgi:hypothetical protein
MNPTTTTAGAGAAAAATRRRTNIQKLKKSKRHKKKVKQNMLANTHAGKIINEHNYTLMSYFSFIARPSAFKKILFITKK